MDRRRFVPRSDTLEGRQLLATSVSPVQQAAAANQIQAQIAANTVQNEPNTLLMKQQRIERLPYYLQQVDPGRTIPAELTQQLQANLTAILTKLHPPRPAILNAFNTRLRDLMQWQSVRPSDAAGLSATFGKVLTEAGATEEEAANLRATMDEFVKLDSERPQPSIVVRNDYAIVVQTALAVGRPTVPVKVPVQVTPRTPRGPAATT